MNSARQSSGWLDSLVFALLFCGYPIVSFIPDFFSLPDRAASIGFRAVCLALCVLLVFTGWSRLRQQGRWLLFMLIFWVLYSARVIYDYLYVGVVGSMELQDFLAYIYGISFATVIAMLAVREPRRLRHAPLICVALCGATCVFANIFGVANFQAELSNRMAANERLNPITLGHTATTLIVCALWYLLKPKEEHHYSSEGTVQRLQRDGLLNLAQKLWALLRAPLMLVAVLVGLYTLALSASRAPAIALGCCLVFYAVWLRGKIVYLAVASLAVVLAFIQLGFMSKVLSLGVNLDRVSNYGVLDEDMGGGRMDLYQEAWDKFTSAPLLGSSLFLDNMIYPHNMILETLMATGIGGGFIFVLLISRAARNYITQARQSAIAFWLALLFLQAFIGAMLSGSIFYDPMMWTTLSLGIGMVTVQARRQERSTLLPPPPARRSFASVR